MGQEIARSHFRKNDFSEFEFRLSQETELLAQYFREGIFRETHPIAGFELPI